MSNFRISASVLFASFLVSSVGLTANAQTSAPSITDKGSIAGFNYSISNKPRGGVARDLMADIINRNVTFSANNNFQYPDEFITATYSNYDGFRGVYSYEGQIGTIEADVSIDVSFYSFLTPTITDIFIGLERDIVMGNYNFGHITTSYSSSAIADSGKFSASDAELSNDKNYGSTGSIKGAFSSDGSTINYPSLIAGEVKLKGFTSNWRYDGNDNALSGVFIAGKDGIVSRNTPITPEQEIVVVEPEPTINYPKTNGFRDTSIASIPQYQDLFRENPSLISFFENQTTILPPGVADEGYGMFSSNGFSPIWYGNPNVDLPMDGQYGLIVDRPEIGGRGWVKMNQNDYNSYFLKVRNDLYDFGLTDESSRAMTMFFMTEINRAVQLGYAEWMKHLNYDPGELSLRIQPGRGEGWIGAYNPTTDEVIISSDWLDEQVIDWINHIRYGEGRNPVFDSLVNLVTHEAAHQFGYENINGDSEGCGDGVKCHAPVDSGSVVSYDAHKGLSVNYHVTEEDVKHIPNATYNEDKNQLYGVFRTTEIGSYGVWIGHYFYVEGTTDPGSDRGGLSYIDSISGNPRFLPLPGFEPEKIPTGSAIYSGEDNLIGADISEHYLGALLQADANLIYNFSTSPTMNLIVDNFEVYYDNKWNQQTGAIIYNLECWESGCGMENGNNLIGVGFTNNGEHTHGRIRDFDNEYVGAFVAEKD